MQRFRAVRHNILGELDMKTGGKEMKNQQKAINMMLMFERMLQEQREMSEIMTVVQRLVQ